MKNLIRERDILSGVTPAALELAASELAFPANIHTARRHHGFAQGFPEIQKIDPAAVPETPLWIRETIHFRLGIQMRVPRGEYPLLEREAIAPNRELRRETHGQGHVALRSELHGLPVEVAEIQGMLQRASGIEAKPQVSPMHRDRRLYIVVKKPSVSEQKAPDIQFE